MEPGQLYIHLSNPSQNMDDINRLQMEQCYQSMMLAKFHIVNMDLIDPDKVNHTAVNRHHYDARYTCGEMELSKRYLLTKEAALNLLQEVAETEEN